MSASIISLATAVDDDDDDATAGNTASSLSSSPSPRLKPASAIVLLRVPNTCARVATPKSVTDAYANHTAYTITRSENIKGCAESPREGENLFPRVARARMNVEELFASLVRRINVRILIDIFIIGLHSEFELKLCTAH